ncbi:MAG: DUF697 domain-containing protein [Candidatus Sericytochromatia bacterium]|nr:DUF697 domain-containing protein [Candidatus Sericytochromatia bacterium]
MRVPTDALKQFLGTWREVRAASAQPVAVALVAPPGRPGMRWQAALDPGLDHPGTLRFVEPGKLLPEADVAIVLWPEGPWDEAAADRLAVTLATRVPRLVLLPNGNEVDLAVATRRAARVAEVAQADVIVGQDPGPAAEAVAAALGRLVPDHVVALARQFTLLRRPLALQEVAATAKQNAVVGALPLPGADMPLMAANQAKMVLRMAAMHDLPLDLHRARELLAVLGASLAWRTAARQLAKFVPGPGWVVGAGMGYSGTLAVGKLALAWFQQQAPVRRLSVGPLEAVVDEGMPGA